MPVPSADSVALKPKSAYRLLGKRVTGVDNDTIVRGKPLYSIDQRVPGMLYATFTKSPAIGGRAVSANLDHVRTLPGVKEAFIVGEQGTPVVFDLSGAPAVASGVAIVANTTWAAFQAKKALQVQWDESNASHDSWTAAVTEAKRLATQPPAQVLGQGGNVDAAFASGRTVEGMYGYHYVSHADLEPQNCTAWHKGDSVEIWAPTQTPQAAVDAIAKLAGLPKDKVLLHQLRGGGGFGRRLANDSVCEAVLISKQAGNLPVKVQWMREDDMAFDYYRAGGFQSFKASVDRAGQALGLSEPLHHVLDGRHDAGRIGNIDKAEFPANVVANQRMVQSLIASKIPTGPWRAPGSNVIAFCVQSFLNECAVAANRDHVEFLVELMGEPRKLPPDPFGGVFNTGRAVAVIKAVAQSVGLGPQDAGRPRTRPRVPLQPSRALRRSGRRERRREQEDHRAQGLGGGRHRPDREPEQRRESVPGIGRRRGLDRDGPQDHVRGRARRAIELRQVPAATHRQSARGRRALPRHRLPADGLRRARVPAGRARDRERDLRGDRAAAAHAAVQCRGVQHLASKLHRPRLLFGEPRPSRPRVRWLS